jgi:hypothetical protein
MKMKAVLILAAALFASTAFAAAAKPVSYKSLDDTVRGILYTPEGKSPFRLSSSSMSGGVSTIGSKSKPRSSRTKATSPSP